MSDDPRQPDDHAAAQRPRMGLSAKLLLLTITFVMISEFLIFAPSIARFRIVYLEEHVASAHLTTVALDESFGVTPTPELEEALLDSVGAFGIILRHPERRVLVLSKDMPPMADVTFDLHDDGVMTLLSDAFSALAQPGDRIMRVMGDVPGHPDTMIEVVMQERPMIEAMYAFSWRILSLSIVISLITAGLVYLSLQWLLVRPMRGITASMTSFRDNPEDEARTIQPSDRSDEVGVAQRELARMQSELRTALRQKSRLATLGAAVAKINHDLRNSLSTAMLVSDRLAHIDDPEVKRVTPYLVSAVDNAVRLCSQTLNYAGEGNLPLHLKAAPVRDMIGQAATILNRPPPDDDGDPATADTVGLTIDNRVPDGLTITADRDQLMRVFGNLMDNAARSGADCLTVSARHADASVAIELADNGPGMPDRARRRLFQPFAGSAREGGTGLGLVIARDIVRAHGGDLTLVATGEDGTTFRIEVPVRAARTGG